MGSESMRVAVVGAGGLGSYVGALLQQAGHDVTLVTRGTHREAIEARGLLVRSHAGDFSVRPRCVSRGEEAGEVDLTFVATKTYSIAEVAPQLAALAKKGSAVVSLLNGVTARQELVALGVDPDLVADGVAYMTAFRVEPGVVERRATHQRIVVPVTRAKEDASARMVKAFAGTIVGIEEIEDIDVELWEKMAVVCSLSVLCAIGDWHMGSLRAHPLGADLQRQAISEVLAVGRATGVSIPGGAEEKIDARLDRFPDSFYPSVIHDLREGRRTEMADLGGAVSRLGRSSGVPTPLHDAGTLIVQRAESTGRVAP